MSYDADILLVLHRHLKYEMEKEKNGEEEEYRKLQEEPQKKCQSSLTFSTSKFHARNKYFNDIDM